MKKYSTQFSKIKVGTVFTKNGNRWFKHSTRTAHIDAPNEPYDGKWFYFGKDDQVIIDDPKLSLITQ